MNVQQNRSQTKPAFVVYFDQHLGTAHFKHWLKYAFLIFLVIASLTCYPMSNSLDHSVEVLIDVMEGSDF